jgi:uncharacterized membrane protein (UPF0127 family)
MLKTIIPKFVNITINKHEFKAKVVMNKREIIRGMSNATFNKSFDSMLFVKPNANYLEQHFWMKKCIIPLDIIFIHLGKVTGIQHNCPPCYQTDCPTYSGFGDLVLEVAGGTCKKSHIRKGNRVIIDNNI